MTSPGHFIIGGVSGNEGVVLTRNADSTDHRFELSDSQWYVAMTNVDVWEQDDKRFDNAIKFLEELGQDNFEPDGQSLIENVLWRDGVIQDDSIFTAAISAYPGTQLTIYDAPSDAKFDAVWSPVDIFSTV
uniref:ceramidase n=1 Tax=Favella ehrenbergii TaxID=182087 RepID=A0A7S3HZ61_9SPIT|mmetsp:Transcript_20141/g.24843  ORF Transcript_20141/g.24843 Transcript_20141/m.24843 type:complete len:131 (+) Transcript_20141:829-1221(+)|eukprot:CAMPEP_0170462646 /NCGR_PEP_ID=MMETSP0123-20130129/8075_1 /TAXON_ID=182087 /ORGANISM="Favella ehrenbergii, Strain Fehren 1" /LENGTH=130 /DNA_ID=CAMNT_0010727921 /DNA_START=829 /DNA_END=1221 /DNA_ORIENTATION=-